MINKSVTLQKHISVGEGIDKKDIAYLTAQITKEYGNFNISIQVLNKENLLANEEYFKNEYNDFEREVKLEAVSNGWNIF